jgi:cell division septum initiation protein DivIVA
MHKDKHTIEQLKEEIIQLHKSIDELKADVNYAEARESMLENNVAQYLEFINENEELWTAFKVAKRIS